MEDRRIRKTKKAFYKALIELLRENNIRNISIQDLCDKGTKGHTVSD